MKTFTVAYLTPRDGGEDVFLAVVADGEDIRSAARQAKAALRVAGRITYESCLAITPQEPQDEGRIVWEWAGEDGEASKYAVRILRAPGVYW